MDRKELLEAWWAAFFEKDCLVSVARDNPFGLQGALFSAPAI